MGWMNFKDNPARWKYGHAKYFFHTPLEYEIIQKGDKVYSPNVADNEIKIKPLSIGHSKSQKRTLLFKGGGAKEVNIQDYSFWIPRRRIRRGPRSWSQKKDRWVHKKTFDQCLARAIKGVTYYVDYY
jgi:hypothetical protein